MVLYKKRFIFNKKIIGIVLFLLIALIAFHKLIVNFTSPYYGEVPRPILYKWTGELFGLAILEGIIYWSLIKKHKKQK